MQDEVSNALAFFLCISNLLAIVVLLELILIGKPFFSLFSMIFLGCYLINIEIMKKKS